MATFRDILSYYRNYRAIAIFSIAMTSIFEILDLFVPYAIGQILNVLSGQGLDQWLQDLIGVMAKLVPWFSDRGLSLAVLLGLVFGITVVRAPVQPWLSSWFHWDISLRTRRDYLRQVLKKILTLPLEFFDEHNPGRIAGRVAKGIENHTWTYPDISGQLIPKLVRVLGIFVLIALIEWRIAILFLASFLFVLVLDLKGLRQLIQREQRLDRYMEDTQSRTSEIITNIKTVKAFAGEASELARQQRRIEREFKVVDYRIHKGYVQLQTW
ncbi:MAG TPA: ABC transporter transmembrane domain-containing protein, partial [Candidatus Caenarcaniphilales bacterium]